MNDDDFYDDERDDRGSVDPTSYDRESAERKSRTCQHCRGSGFATIFDFEYTGSAVVVGIDDQGNHRPRAGRTCAYCICLFGRWLLENHKKTAKDVYARTPDFADIHGRSSFWLERDPTHRELTEAEIVHLPQSWQERLIERMSRNQPDVR